jgi:hypothetical protein
VEAPVPRPRKTYGPSTPAHEIASKKTGLAGRKISLMQSATEFLIGWRCNTRNTAKIRSSVTTTHLSWPNQRRKVAASLRFRLPNLDFQVREQRQGGRGSAAAIRREASTAGRIRVAPRRRVVTLNQQNAASRTSFIPENQWLRPSPNSHRNEFRKPS